MWRNLILCSIIGICSCTSRYELCRKEGHTITQCHKYYMERMERYQTHGREKIPSDASDIDR